LYGLLLRQGLYVGLRSERAPEGVCSDYCCIVQSAAKLADARNKIDEIGEDDELLAPSQRPGAAIRHEASNLVCNSVATKSKTPHDKQNLVTTKVARHESLGNVFLGHHYTAEWPGRMGAWEPLLRLTCT
jgi:hypothetical protein